MYLHPGVGEKRMIGKMICKVLKGLFVTGWICSASPEVVANVGCSGGQCYVTSSGGSGSACTLAAPCTPDQAIQNTSVCGDTINFLAGTYNTDKYSVQDISCSLGTPLTLQSNGWTSIGSTHDEVIIESVVTGTSWTQCTPAGNTGPNCSAPCAGLATGVPCGHVFYATGDSSSGNTCSPKIQFNGAKTAQGTTTYSVNSLADMTNNHSTTQGSYPAFNNKVCSSQTWRSCNKNSDCVVPNFPTSTCTSTQPERDSFAQAYTSTNFFINMGAATSPGNVLYSDRCNSGNGFQIKHSTGIIVQGFIFRNHRRAGVAIVPSSCSYNCSTPTYPSCTGLSAHIIIRDNTFFYAKDEQGSDYHLAVIAADDVLVESNEFAYAGSESHIEGIPNNVATVVTMKNNWMHHNGEAKVMGPFYAYGERQNTPNAFIFGEISGRCGTGNYTGSKIHGNLIEDLPNNSVTDNGSGNNSSGIGIIFENDSDGVETYNNIFRNTGGEGIKCSATGTNPVASCSNHQIYNNIFYRNGTNPGGGSGAAILFTSSGSNPVDSNLVFNNTFYNPGTFILKGEGTGTNITNTLIRNNIFFDSADHKPIEWPASWPTSNKLEYNLFSNPHNPLMDVGSTHYADCAAINASGYGTLGNNVCQNPGFLSPNNFSFYPMGGGDSSSPISPTNFLTNSMFGGPAIDAGTATGMPVNKSAGIVNTLATLHEAGFYSDTIPQGGSAWDIGAVESLLSYGKSPIGWSVYTPSACTGGAATFAPGTSGNGFAFWVQRDPARLCSGVSQTMTLTVGQPYLIGLVRQSALGSGDLTIDASTPPNYTPTTTSTCGDDRVDDWHLTATNATIEEITPTGQTFRGGFSDERTPTKWILTPTSASVTLKAEVTTGGIYLNCPEVAYFFYPLEVTPRPTSHCSISTSTVCYPDACDYLLNCGCPTLSGGQEQTCP